MSEQLTKPKTKAVPATNQVNQVADLENRLNQAKAENLKNLELVKDLKAVVKLVVDFKNRVGFPTKWNLLWVASNYKQIVQLLKDIVFILKTKSTELA